MAQGWGDRKEMEQEMKIEIVLFIISMTAFLVWGYCSYLLLISDRKNWRKQEMKRILTITLLATMLAGCKKVRIEQEVKTQSFINCTYRVSTWLWIYDFPWCLGSTIEHSFYNYNVTKDSVCAVKVRQLKAMLPYYIKAKQILKDGIDPCKERP